MISIDSNILLPAIHPENKSHVKAAGFLQSLQNREDVVFSEFVLLELYTLLRNPTILARPLSSRAAADVREAFRHHPVWQVVGFPSESRAFHDVFWPRLHEENFARRRADDWRTALSLLQQGVTEFATVNLKDFQGFGFGRVWNPLAD